MIHLTSLWICVTLAHCCANISPLPRLWALYLVCSPDCLSHLGRHLQCRLVDFLSVSLSSGLSCRSSINQWQDSFSTQLLNSIGSLFTCSSLRPATRLCPDVAFLPRRRQNLKTSKPLPSLQYWKNLVLTLIIIIIFVPSPISLSSPKSLKKLMLHKFTVI